MCEVTAKVIKGFDRDSSIASTYTVESMGRGVVGQTKTNDAKFLFKKYESGWRIEGPTR